MQTFIDLDRYPLDREGSAEWTALVATCRAALAAEGMFNLEGFLRPAAIAAAVAEVMPAMAAHSHEHKRSHNIYFKPEIAELPDDHPALRRVETVSHTLCADQLASGVVLSVYEYARCCGSLPPPWTSPRCTRCRIRWPGPMSCPIARARR